MASRHFPSLRKQSAPAPAAESGAARGDFLFLYGTLRRGGVMFRTLGLSGRLAPAGAAAMRGALYSLGAYPGLVPGGRGLVHGELYRVLDPRVFAPLDRYEDFWPDDPAASLFRRVRAPLSGRADTAWVYVYNRETGRARPIPSGRWTL